MIFDPYITIAAKAIMCSHWCVECEEREYAYYIYKGDSLCEQHFKNRKLV